MTHVKKISPLLIEIPRLSRGSARSYMEISDERRMTAQRQFAVPVGGSTPCVHHVAEGYSRNASIHGLDVETEIHIEDATHAYLMAYERFEQYGCRHDRDVALQLLHARDEALRNLPDHIKAARHAAFERELEEQWNYFGAGGEHLRDATEG